MEFQCWFEAGKEKPAPAFQAASGGQSRVCLVVLAYNDWSQTERCLESLSKLDFPSCRVIIVDNASAVPCPDRILAEFPDAELLVNPQNLGYAQGCNSGIRHAQLQNPEYIWLLNNDTEVHPASLAALVELSDSDGRLGAVGSLLLDSGPDRKVQAWGGGRISYLTGLSTARLGPDSRLDYICGASLFIRSSALNQVGLLDPGFFLYWEDTDICFRLRAGGWKLGTASRSIVVHKGSGSTVFQSAFYDYHYTASSVRFFRLHCRFWPWPVFVSVAGRMVMRMLRGKADNAVAVWKALRHAISDDAQSGSQPWV